MRVLVLLALLLAGHGGSRVATEHAVNEAAAKVKATCGKASPTGPFGKTHVRVLLAHDGRSKAIEVGTGFEGTPTGACALAAFDGLSYPPWKGDDVTLNWPVEIPKPR